MAVVHPAQLQFKGLTSYDNVSYFLKIPQEHMQLTLIIIATFLAVLQLMHFQPWWHHTTSSLHTYVSHTFVQLDFL